MPLAQRVSDRRNVSAVAVVLGIVVFVVVAVLKPWAALPSPAATPSASAAAVVALSPSASASAEKVATPSPAPPTTAPRTTPPGVDRGDVRIGLLNPGTYAYLDVDRQGFNVAFTVPAGWTWNGRYLSKGGVDPPHGAAVFFFGGPVVVYTDPCHWFGAEPDPPTGSATWHLTAALAAQPMRNAGTQFDRYAASLGLAGRWPGTAVELTVPDDIDFAKCDGGEFRSWGPGNNARSHQGPGQRDLVWAVDVYGVSGEDQNGVSRPTPPGGLIIDAASFPGTPADVMSEVEAILGSIVVGHWG